MALPDLLVDAKSSGCTDMDNFSRRIVAVVLLVARTAGNWRFSSNRRDNSISLFPSRRAPGLWLQCFRRSCDGGFSSAGGGGAVQPEFFLEIAARQSHRHSGSVDVLSATCPTVKTGRGVRAECFWVGGGSHLCFGCGKICVSLSSAVVFPVPLTIWSSVKHSKRFFCFLLRGLAATEETSRRNCRW